MNEERSQKELFEFQEPKKPFSKLANILPKPDFEGRIAVTLTLEKIVFIFIGMIMVMVLVFALGVESGKARDAARRQNMPKAQKASQPIRAAVPVMAIQPTPVAGRNFFNMAQTVSSARTTPQKAPGAPVKAAIAPEGSKPYTIVAVTFSKIETAQAAAVSLSKDGFSSSVVYSDPYYKVCVGSYADTYGAQVRRDLAKLRRVYKDAFVRLR